MRREIMATVAVGALCLAAGIAHAGTIDTTPFWNGSDAVAPWGETGSGDTPTYGQTFTATNALGLNLTDFSFRIRQNNDGVGPISYQAYVFAWTGSAITGPALFTSGVQNVPFGGSYQTVTINTGGTALSNGTEYVAMFSTAGLGGSDGSAVWGLPSSHNDAAYTGGRFVYSNTTSFANLTSPWDGAAPGYGDLAFTMNFTSGTAVPLPPAAWSGLAGLGALGLAGVLRRRRSAPLS